jgi:RNA polymerase sigma-70 factor (ECF subfamily)
MERGDNVPVNIPADAASKPGDETVAHEPTDRELVDRCQRGELDAYERLVARHRHRVYNLAYGMLRNEQDALDVCQEAFVRAWQSIRSFKKSAAFYTWMYRITTNLCIDFVRRRDRRPSEQFEEGVEARLDPDVEVAPSHNPSPATEAQRSELRAQIDAALLQLSPEHRAVIQLREYEGLDYAEIARVLKCRIGTVMSRLHYARKALQKLLREVI